MLRPRTDFGRQPPCCLAANDTASRAPAAKKTQPAVLRNSNQATQTIAWTLDSTYNVSLVDLAVVCMG